MSILDDILQRTRADVMDRCAQRPLSELEGRCRACRPARDFVRALRRQVGINGRRVGHIRVIAEVKKASPSKGVIRPDFAPADLARAYARAGAHAISVLTDGRFFRGSLGDLRAARDAVELPVLRKEFVISSYQIYESRVHRADAILLIAAALDPSHLLELYSLAKSLSLHPLVEIHTVEELETADKAGATLIGINNRDLATFETRLETTFALLPHIAPEAVVVSESGISRAEDVKRLASAGVDAILVGEVLLKSADPGAKLRELLQGAAG